MSLEDVCRPGPVFHPPPLPLAGSSSRMRDSFDHRGSRESSDERSSLLGEDTEMGGENLENGEEEEEFQTRPSRDDSVMSKVASPERILRKNGSLTSSPAAQEPSMGPTPALIGSDHKESNDWQCDFAGCGRRFQKRHDLKQVPHWHYILTSKHPFNLTDWNPLH